MFRGREIYIRSNRKFNSADVRKERSFPISRASSRIAGRACAARQIRKTGEGMLINYSSPNRPSRRSWKFIPRPRLDLSIPARFTFERTEPHPTVVVFYSTPPDTCLSLTYFAVTSNTRYTGVSRIDNIPLVRGTLEKRFVKFNGAYYTTPG